VLMSFVESAVCHNNGMIYLFTRCDLFEITCLIVCLLHNIFVYSSKTLAALSSRDAVVNRCFVASNWVSVFVLMEDVSPDLLLLPQYTMDCKSSNPLSTVSWLIHPYHSCRNIGVEHVTVTDKVCC
jgi:hypothetical protein